jgi:hypothetical protein
VDSQQWVCLDNQQLNYCSSTIESAWVSSSIPTKVNISISTSYTNTVYVTKATTATTTVDCGKGTMIYGNGSAPASTPSIGLLSNMPIELPSDWSKSIPFPFCDHKSVHPAALSRLTAPTPQSPTPSPTLPQAASPR